MPQRQWSERAIARTTKASMMSDIASSIFILAHLFTPLAEGRSA